jgi:hypothetical protein
MCCQTVCVVSDSICVVSDGICVVSDGICVVSDGMCCVRRYTQYKMLMLFRKVLFHSKILSQKQIICCTGKSLNYRIQKLLSQVFKNFVPISLLL